jgi:hypothetical protein
MISRYGNNTRPLLEKCVPRCDNALALLQTSSHDAKDDLER